MAVEEIIRVWKDARYRQSLSADQLALLPENPAGAIELNANDLELVNGDANPETTAADLGVFFVSLSPPFCPCSFALQGRR